MSTQQYSGIQVKELIEMLQAINPDNYISIKVNASEAEDPEMDIDDLENIEIWDDGDETCTLFISK